MMRRKTGAILAILACSLAPVGVARADGPVPPVPIAQPKPASSPYLLSGDRFLEVNVSTTLQLDWNGLAASDGPTAHAGVVLGGEIGVPFDEQRVRPALFSGVKLGGWADETEGPFAFVEGARLRLSPFMWDVFDIYVVARADFDLDPRASPVFRPGLGVGLRAARMLAVEATWDVTVPLGSTFTGTRHPDFVPYGISFGVLFDACFKCNRSAPVQTSHDLACRLYNAAAAAGKKPARQRICDGIAQAMTASPNPETAPRDEDGTSTFLKMLATTVSGDDAKGEVRALADLHDKLTAQWAQYQQRAAGVAQEGQRLSELWTYAPVPAELRAYLGCDKSEQTGQEIPAPVCQENTN